MSLEDESASVQGDVVLPWPLTAAGSLIKKQLLGLRYWFVLNLDPGCQQHFQCECGGFAFTVCCYWDSRLLLTAILPVHSVRAGVTHMQPFTLMAVYPKMIHLGEGSCDVFVLGNRIEQPVKHWVESQRTKSSRRHSVVIHIWFNVL